MKKNKVKEDLQDILTDFMNKDASTIDMLKNNSKTIGGVIGMEHALHEKMNARNEMPSDELFHEGKDLRF